MSRRTKPTNAFQALTTGLVSTGADIIPLDVIGDLDFPSYIILSPFNASLREVIKYESINASTVTTLTRGMAGSVGGVAHEHPTNTIAISAPTEQLIDDIFADIENLEGGTGSWATADAAHVAAGDPHTQYSDAADLALKVDKAGGTMTGELIVPVAVPSGDAVAANKKYVDDISSAVGLPAGTRMIFDQDTAPAGWTRDTVTVDDRMIMIVTGARGGDDGTWQQPTHDHTAPSHIHVAPLHVHVAPLHDHSIPSHAHTNPSTGAAVGTATAQENGGTNFSYAIGSHTHTQTGTSTQPVGTTGDDGNQNTSNVSGGNVSADGDALTTADAPSDTWRPLHRDMIIAVKD